MLQIIRKRQKYLLTIFVSMIAVVFIFWGFYGGFTPLGNQEVASINGEAITIQEFETQFRRISDLYQNILKDKFTSEMAERFNLKQQALSQLIDQKLIIQGAKTIGLQISDKEIQDEVIAVPYFKRNNQFDPELYRTLLKSNRLTPTVFEENIRLDLLQRRIVTLLRSHLKVSPEEVFKEYLLKGDKVNIEFIKVDANHFKSKINPSTEELKKYSSQKGKTEEAKNFYTKNSHIYEDKGKQKTFEEVKDTILKNFYLDEIGNRLAKEATNKLWLARANSSQFKKMLSDEKLQWEETGLFTRSTKFIPKIGEAPSILKAAFSLSEKEVWPLQYFQTKNRFFIIKLKKKENANFKNFEKERAATEEALLNQKQSGAYYEWLKEMKDASKIKIRKGIFDTQES